MNHAPFGQPEPTWRRRLQHVLAWSTVAAMAATGCDFAVYTLVIQSGLLTPAQATFLGCCIGAWVNYGINRIYTFKSQGPKLGQLLRYGIVSLCGGLLSSGLVALLLALKWLGPQSAWCLVRCLISWGWHLPMQHFYVFSKAHTPRTQGL